AAGAGSRGQSGGRRGAVSGGHVASRRGRLRRQGEVAGVLAGLHPGPQRRLLRRGVAGGQRVPGQAPQLAHRPVLIRGRDAPLGDLSGDRDPVLPGAAGPRRPSVWVQEVCGATVRPNPPLQARASGLPVQPLAASGKDGKRPARKEPAAHPGCAAGSNTAPGTRPPYFLTFTWNPASFSALTSSAASKSPVTSNVLALGWAVSPVTPS